MAKKLSLSDLRAASYNPRTITSKRLRELDTSIDRFGDLSGVTLNRRSGVLVTGHQRVKTLEGKKVQVVTHPHQDDVGTVELGYIEVQGKNGALRIPLRVVDWSDKKVEMAANIAANAAGGSFDRDKLRAVLAKLENGKFDVEVTGLDPLLIRSLRMAEPDAVQQNKGGASGSTPAEFEEFSEDSFVHELTCPKCKYQWNPKGVSSRKEKK